MRDTASGCLGLEAVQSFVRGMADAGAADRIEEHLDGCDDCRALVAALARGEGGQSVAGTIAGLDATAAAALAQALTGFDLGAPDRLSAERSLLGSILADTYQLVRVVGMGGMGVIYEARHARLRGKRYAVKLLGGQHAGSSEVLARFRREAEIASRLGNEHIVETHDFNVSDGRAYMVMELLEGEDLAGRIKARGALPLGDAMHITGQAASALDAAHRAQIVHRDLKPSNVYLCRRGGRDDHVKLLDFGLSKVLDSMTVMTRQYSLLGTPAYMSPEQAEGRIQEVDQRSDVFALAAIVWEMLTGTMAFAAPTIADALHRVRFVDPPDVHLIRPEVPPAVSAALRRALAKDRLARTPAVAELAGELTAAMRGSGPASMTAAPERQVSRDGLALAATAAPVAPSVHHATAPAVHHPTIPVVHQATAPAQWPAVVPTAPASVMPPPPQWIAPALPGPPTPSGPFLPVPPSPSAPFLPVPPSPSGPYMPMPAPAGSRPGQTVPAPRGLIIAIVAGALVAVGVWLAVARTLTPGSGSPTAETEPVAEPTEPRPGEPTAPVAAVPEPFQASPAPETPEKPATPAVTDARSVSLTFTVEPRVAADIRVDGERVARGRISVERSGEPVAVTAEARGYSTFRAHVVPDQDRTVPIVLHRARHRTRAAARARAATPTPKPAPRQAAPQPATAAPAPQPQPAAPQPAAPRPAPASPPPAASPAPEPQPRPAPKQQPKPKPRPGAGTIFDQ
jgi:serine/threonine-protein kinase